MWTPVETKPVVKTGNTEIKTSFLLYLNENIIHINLYRVAMKLGLPGRLAIVLADIPIYFIYIP